MLAILPTRHRPPPMKDGLHSPPPRPAPVCLLRFCQDIGKPSSASSEKGQISRYPNALQPEKKGSARRIVSAAALPAVHRRRPQRQKRRLRGCCSVPLSSRGLAACGTELLQDGFPRHESQRSIFGLMFHFREGMRRQGGPGSDGYLPADLRLGRVTARYFAEVWEIHIRNKRVLSTRKGWPHAPAMRFVLFIQGRSDGITS